jgi:hypothetical protein
MYPNGERGGENKKKRKRKRDKNEYNVVHLSF